MSEETYVVTIHPPSRKRIAKATGVALVVAAALLVTAVLPAEYGIDPLGTGKALHLTDLSKADATKAAPKTQPPPSSPTASDKKELNATIIPVLEPAADGGAPRMKGTFIEQPKGYKMDSREMTLKAGEGLEI